MKLVVATQDYVGLGFAVRLRDEGHEVILYFRDVWKKDDLHRIAGYDADGYALLVNAHGFTLETAWESVLEKAAQIRFPYRHYRADGDQTNYPSSPIRRYEALKAMGYI